MTEYRELIFDIPSPSDIVQSVWRTLVRLTPGRGGRWALLLIAIGALIRMGLVLLDWPRTDSDEGTMGLMALHNLSRSEHPVFFYGQTIWARYRRILAPCCLPCSARRSSRCVWAC